MPTTDTETVKVSGNPSTKLASSSPVVNLQNSESSHAITSGKSPMIYCNALKALPHVNSAVKSFPNCGINIPRTTATRGLTDTTNIMRNTPQTVFKTPRPPGAILVKATPDSTKKEVIVTPQNGVNAPRAQSSSMKRTPPMCSCGKRSKRKAVQTPGPNVGRFFFCCPVGRAGGSSKYGCGFFKWETAMSSPMTTNSSSTFFTPRSTLNPGVGGVQQGAVNHFVSPPPQPNFDTPQSVNRTVTAKIKSKTLGIHHPKPTLASLR